MIYDNKCAIWQTPAEWRQEDVDRPVIVSPRAGGAYQIRKDLSYDGSPLLLLDEHGKARLTTWLVNQRRGMPCPVVTDKGIEVAKNAQDMRVSERADRILQLLAKKTHKLGTAVEVDPFPSATGFMFEGRKTYLELLAHSESVGESRASAGDDLKFLLRYLKGRGMMMIGGPRHDDLDKYYLTLTVLGHDRVAELEHVVNATSGQVFVAMWFGKDLKTAYENSIKPAIDAAGYEAIRVDKQHYVGNIVDKIISEIRRSRFVVADFSQDKCARGGVYYEAGFARGLGLKVISTCRKADEKKLHFDILQDNHILWETEDDLRKRLEERISAVMGDGPLRDPESA